jgi:DNA-directed RNA polymerase specialized sigma24 family protein
MAAQPRTLAPEQFEALLAALDADRTQAGERYDALHRRLVQFFGWENGSEPEALADEVMDRVARRICEGEPVTQPAAYAMGVARFVLREDQARARRNERALLEMPKRETEDARPMECLERCLGTMPEAARGLLMAYYSGDGGARIARRKQLAAELGIELNALRNRALRLRQQLERCVAQCCRERA